MKVQITEFNVEQELKNNGMQLDIYSPNGDERLGDLSERSDEREVQLFFARLPR